MPLSPSLGGRRREKALPTLFSHMMDGGDLDKASEREKKKKEGAGGTREKETRILLRPKCQTFNDYVHF